MKIFDFLKRKIYTEKNSPKLEQKPVNIEISKEQTYFKVIVAEYYSIQDYVK